MDWQQLKRPATRAVDVTGVGGQAVPSIDLQQAVQDALQDLVSAAGLQHEDSWELGGLQVGVSEPAVAPQGSARGSQQATTMATARRSPVTANQHGELGLEQEEEEAAREKDLPPQAALRLYQARLRSAQADLAGLKEALKNRDAKLGGVEKELQQLRLEKAAWQKAHKALESQAERSKRAAEEARARAQEQENALKQVAAERRASQQERRQADQDIKAREERLSAALEEAQRLRRALEEARTASSARAGVSREEHGRVVAENRQLAAQKQELVVAFKKAAKLIDVLRRQKVHLEAAALLQVSSRELAEALHQGQ